MLHNVLRARASKDDPLEGASSDYLRHVDLMREMSNDDTRDEEQTGQAFLYACRRDLSSLRLKLTVI